MRIGGRHLSYCTNIHPAETLSEVRAVVAGPVAAVKALVCPDAPFGVGLRLSARAAEALSDPGALAEFRALLDAHGLYVFTLNGFPYGAFSGQRIKEEVYLPDWRDPRRVTYTEALARICAALTPDPLGTVSTVPGAFRARVASIAHLGEIVNHLKQMAVFLDALYEETGKTIVLALEPEPACLLETTAETVTFFREHLLGGADRERVRRHIGVCLDACHLSVAFERPADAVRALREADIRIAKLQLSTGLAIALDAGDSTDALRPFCDEVYLHQVTERAAVAVGVGEKLRRFVDLPDALKSPPRTAAEWRIHFHVPIFRRALGAFTNTQDDLAALLREVDASGCSHLEVETYSWDVLPPELREGPVEAAIARELAWVRERL